MVEGNSRGVPDQEYFIAGRASETMTAQGRARWFRCCFIPTALAGLSGLVIYFLKDTQPEEFNQLVTSLKEIIR